jgi:hypothetical protein
MSEKKSAEKRKAEMDEEHREEERLVEVFQEKSSFFLYIVCFSVIVILIYSIVAGFMR